MNKTSQNGWHIFSSSNLFVINYFFHEILMKHFCNKIIKRNISWKHTFKRIIMLPQKWFSPHCDQIRDADDENLNCWKDTRAITWLGKIPCTLVFSRKRQIDHFMSVLIKIRLKSGRLIFDFPFNVQCSKIYNWSSNLEKFSW